MHFTSTCFLPTRHHAVTATASSWRFWGWTTHGDNVQLLSTSHGRMGLSRFYTLHRGKINTLGSLRWGEIKVSAKCPFISWPPSRGIRLVQTGLTFFPLKKKKNGNKDLFISRWHLTTARQGSVLPRPPRKSIFCLMSFSWSRWITVYIWLH